MHSRYCPALLKFKFKKVNLWQQPKTQTRALCYEYNKELNKTSQLMPTEHHGAVEHVGINQKSALKERRTYGN